MISGQKTSYNKNKLFGINHQIYENINTKSKLNIQHNSKSKSNNIFITPTKLQKYTELYSKYKSHTKASTKQNTNSIDKSRSTFKPSFSLYRFSKINPEKRYPSLISTFDNNILNPKTPNKKSRNINQKFQRNSTMDKGVNLDKLYPNINSINSLSTRALMHNTMKGLRASYKKFFLDKKKLNITSNNKNKNNKIKNSINSKSNNKYNVKSNKVMKLKKNISMNNEECFNNNNINYNINEQVIKSIFDLRIFQNKIKIGLNKKDEKIKKKSADNNEFSFNRDFIMDNYYIENDEMKKLDNNNETIIDFVNNNEKSNLIQSNLMTNLSEIERNKKIYDENYECDTPQFTTLNEQAFK